MRGVFAADSHGEPGPNLAGGDALWPQTIFDQVTAFTTKCR